MLPSNKIRWVGGFALAGFLLILTLLGGDWGTMNKANAGVNDAPIVYSIYPDKTAGGIVHNVIVIISGANFGILKDTAVRIRDASVDDIIKPLSITPGGDGISFVIDYGYLLTPTVYDISVVKSTFPSVPTIPLTFWDQESTPPVTFTVFPPNYIHLPIVSR